jgi:hypothetical protein
VRQSHGTQEAKVITGLLACGTDGKIHKTPLRASSNNHSFGVAAIRDEETNAVSVTLYTEIRGERRGELTYAGPDWDTNFLEPLREASQRGVEDAYLALEGLLAAFSHPSLRTILNIDPNHPDPTRQVTLTQHDEKGITGMVTDSIRAFGAFLTAVQDVDNPFAADSLVAVTRQVPEAEYFATTEVR